MSAPLVSVILPVRDSASTLDVALRSIARQSLAGHEVVAVDDGSLDDSARILDAAAARDPRLRVIHAERRGLVPALNAALREARGDLIARMDADDIAHRHRLMLQHQRFVDDPSLSILATRVRLLGGAANEGMHRYVAWSNALLSHEEICRDLLVEAPLVHPSVMMWRRDIEALGGYRDCDGPEDYDLWLRARGAGMRFAKLEGRLLLWRDGPRRLTRSHERYAPERFLDLKIRFLLDRPKGQATAVVWGAGPLGKALGRGWLRHGGRLAGWADVAPGRIGQRILGATVLSPHEAASVPAALHLAAVGQPGARERIRGLAASLGLTEGVDFFTLA